MAFEWATKKKLIVYHTNWSCYQRNYQVSDLPIDLISDINYAFLNLVRSPNHNNNFIPVFTDQWADFDKRYTNDNDILPKDSWDESCKGPFGNIGQFTKLKAAGKQFNLGISIGGWSMSKNFSLAVASVEARESFICGLIEIVNQYKVINRINIDWEYLSPPNENYGDPANIVNENDSKNFSLFLKSLRNQLPRYIEISACTSGHPSKIDALPLDEMVKYLDTINIMTYDYSSSAWGSCLAGHHTNLRSVSPYATNSVENTVNAFIAKGVPPSKIVIGVAFYSRGFANCDGLGKPSHGTVLDKSWEDGVVDYKALPLSGACEYFDEEACAGYSYDPVKRILNSYDTVKSVEEKCNFVVENGLKGIICWESSGDFSDVQNPRSLIAAMHRKLSS